MVLVREKKTSGNDGSLPVHVYIIPNFQEVHHTGKLTLIRAVDKRGYLSPILVATSH